MLGKPLLWVAQQAGHSVEVMLRMYAKWLQGATPADIDAIRRFMDGTEPGLRAEVVAAATASVNQVTSLPLQPPRFGTRLALEGRGQQGKLRKRFGKQLAERVGLLRPSWPQALWARRCAPSKIAPGDFVEPACLSARGFESNTVPQPPWAAAAQLCRIDWRRGWDSNPRAGITRPSDFESAPL
jgi:hypothetical protein